jgi:hypothetical protein
VSKRKNWMIGVQALQFYCTVTLYGGVVWYNCMAYVLP